MQKELTKMFITEKKPKSEILKVLGLTSNQYRYLLTKYNLHDSCGSSIFDIL